MINELYELSRAMEAAGIRGKVMAQNLSVLPNNRCFCVRLDQDHISSITEVPNEKKSEILKYGTTSGGAYPYVKLAPLYHVTDADIVKKINGLKKKPERISEYPYDEIRAWCTVNNWASNVKRSFKHTFDDVPKKLTETIGVSYEPLLSLIQATKVFSADSLHAALERYLFERLTNRVDVEMALTMLFNTGKEADKAGSIAFLFDSVVLYNSGLSTMTAGFSEEWNHHLLSIASRGASSTSELDAFGQPYTSTEEPMPEVKLGVGCNAKIRTMNPDVPCQARYKLGGSCSYPSSTATRRSLSAALSFIGDKENNLKTWMCISTGKAKEKEVPRDFLFVFPSELNSVPERFATFFSKPKDPKITFLAQAQSFLKQLYNHQALGTDSRAQSIHIFIIRRIDLDNTSGRMRVLLTRQTDPYELEHDSEEWTIGCSENLPKFPFGQPEVPFPLDSADILNRFWKQDGTPVTNQFKPVPKHHGLELLLEPSPQIKGDLQPLVQSGIALAAFLGRKTAKGDYSHPVFAKAKEQLALMGLLLYRANIRKETYMESYPYLYGQLLKASDELHLLYCKVVRDGSIPAQLAGGAMFLSATEAPVRTLNDLGQRMIPYLQWAKAYRSKTVKDDRRGLVAWLLNQYERLATQLYQAWIADNRFTDEEKAQLFLGYLAAFPKNKDDAVEEPITEEAECDE